MKKLLIALGFVILALVVALQIHNPFQNEPGESKSPHLGEYVPTQARGWEVEDKDIGPTESLRNRAIGILNFDEYIYRNYSRANGSEFFEVYIAYWAPGKVSTMEVSSHTPDRCWTENGWQVLERKHAVQEVINGTRLLPSEWRKFEINGNEQYVHFWHLVGGKPYSYGERLNKFPTPVSYVRDVLQSEILGTGEQYFVRVNTNIPFEELWKNPGFQKVIEGVAGLGIKMNPANLES